MGEQGNYYDHYTGLDMSRTSDFNRQHVQHGSSIYYGLHQRSCPTELSSFNVVRTSNTRNGSSDVKPIVIEPQINSINQSMRPINHVTGYRPDDRFNSCSSPPDEAGRESGGNGWIESDNEGRSGSRSRSERKPISDDLKDEKYYERRHRNNDAAKRSRDARKKRMDAIIHRSNILEHENLTLRAQRSTLYDQLCAMREMAIKRGKRFEFNTSATSVHLSDMKSL